MLYLVDLIPDRFRRLACEAKELADLRRQAEEETLKLKLEAAALKEVIEIDMIYFHFHHLPQLTLGKAALCYYSFSGKCL